MQPPRQRLAHLRPDEVVMPADRLGIDLTACVVNRARFDTRDYALQWIDAWPADPRGLRHGR
jgi:hypothetical protein